MPPVLPSTTPGPPGGIPVPPSACWWHPRQEAGATAGGTGVYCGAGGSPHGRGSVLARATLGPIGIVPVSALPGHQLILLEPEADLPLGRLHRIAGVDHVPAQRWGRCRGRGVPPPAPPSAPFPYLLTCMLKSPRMVPAAAVAELVSPTMARVDLTTL